MEYWALAWQEEGATVKLSARKRLHGSQQSVYLQHPHEAGHPMAYISWVISSVLQTVRLGAGCLAPFMFPVMVPFMRRYQSVLLGVFAAENRRENTRTCFRTIAAIQLSRRGGSIQCLYPSCFERLTFN